METTKTEITIYSLIFTGVKGRDRRPKFHILDFYQHSTGATVDFDDVETALVTKLQEEKVRGPCAFRVISLEHTIEDRADGIRIKTCYPLFRKAVWHGEWREGAAFLGGYDKNGQKLPLGDFFDNTASAEEAVAS